MMKFKFLIITLFISAFSTPIFAYAPVDSVGVENQNGKKIILHKVEPKENFYSIARKYKVEPKAVIAFNNNAPTLTIGQVIKVPTDLPFAEPAKTITQKRPVVDVNGRISPATQKPDDKPSNEPTQYKVGAGETLYGISKRFNTTVDAITKLNNLKSVNLTPGQILLISGTAPVVVPPAQTVTQQVTATQQTVQQMAQKPVVQVPPVQQPQTPVAKRDSTAVVATLDTVDMNHRNVPANRYGLLEKNEKGVAVWMDSDNLDPTKKWVLHRTAPIGTVIKITNPMTNRTTFAKVVGRFTDNENNRDAIMVITKSVAESIGAVDKRFHVTISYGMPDAN